MSPRARSEPHALGLEPVGRGGTFRVLEDNLPALRLRVERLGRRAERLGTAPLVLRDTGRRDGQHAFAVLEGEPPTLAGWTLAAIVDHRESAPTIRVVCSAAPRLDLTRFGEPRCDHCHLRRRRAETFVLWHAASDRLRQVGTGCMRDFLDGHDPERLCRQAEYVLLARQALNAAAAPSHPDLRRRRGRLAGAVRHPRGDGGARARLGVTRAGRARRSARSASADAALHSLQATPDAPLAADLALARGALRWARELLAAKPELSEFERDAVAVASSHTVVTRRERGLVCALIAVYRRRRLRSRHLGRIGEWLDAVVLVERVAAEAICPSWRGDAPRIRRRRRQPAGVVADAWDTAADRAGDPPARTRRAPHPFRARRDHSAGPLPTARSTVAVAIARLVLACKRSCPCSVAVRKPRR